MSYIASYKVSLPKFTIADNVLHPRGKEKTRSISYVDEDVITLAYSAACELDSDVEAVLFATTTPVFKDRYHASFLAGLLNISEGIMALDLGSTERCGTDALMLANTWVNSGQYKKVLVVASNVRFPEIGKETSTAFGHGAIALIISKEKGLAEISDTDSFSASVAEGFKYKGSKIQYDSRFARTAGFKNNIDLSLKKLDPAEIDMLMLNSAYSKLAFGKLKKAGIDMDKQFLADTQLSKCGHLGGAHGLLRVIEAVENEKKTSVLIDYANGSNVITINKLKSQDKTFIGDFGNKTSIKSYQDYLGIRKQGKFERLTYEKLDLFSSEMMQEREKDQFVFLKGFQCTDCGSVYYLKAARCNKCKGTSFEEKQLSKSGVVFSFTAEYYFPSSFPPINMIIVDLDGGGRITVQQTDDMYQDKESMLKIGDKVGLVFRKMMENDSKPNYFWKCVKNE